jgi:hypothetical protein
VKRSLDDGIRFSVDRPDTMSVHHQVTDLIAVFQPGWRTIETAGENSFVCY